MSLLTVVAIECASSKRTRPAHANAGRCVFNELAALVASQHRPMTPALALFVALFAPRAEVCELLFGQTPEECVVRDDV